MNITWYGETCFQLVERGRLAIVTDPYPPDIGLALPRLHPNIVTASRDDRLCRHTTALQGPFRLLDGPGEYEISGIFVTGIATFADDRRGALRGLNTVFTFDFDGLTICHLGWLGHVPTRSHMEDLGTVDLLLLPVGGGESLTPAQASEAISLFEPAIVIPMHYQVPGLKADLGTVDHFLKEMGIEKVDRREMLKIRESDLSEETQVVVLEPHQRNGG